MNAIYDIANVLVTLWCGHVIGEWIADVRADLRAARRVNRKIRAQ